MNWRVCTHEYKDNQHIYTDLERGQGSIEDIIILRTPKTENPIIIKDEEFAELDDIEQVVWGCGCCGSPFGDANILLDLIDAANKT